MASPKKRKTLNIVMAVVAAVIVVAGVGLAFGLKGGGLGASSGFATSDQVGNVNIVRSGVSYSLDEDSQLKDGDVIETLSGSHVTVSSQDLGSITLDEGCRLTVNAQGDGALELSAGVAFCQAKAASDPLTIVTDQGSVASSQGVFVVSARTGSTAVSILAGSVTENVQGKTYEAGTVVNLMLAKDSKKVQVDTGKLSASALNDFALEQAKALAKEGVSLALDAKALQKALDQRSQEHKASQSAAAGSDSAISTSAEGSGSSSSGQNASSTGGTGAAQGGNSSEKPSQGKQEKKLYCTIEIRCDTILSNMSDLKEGKDKYVPSDGVVMKIQKVQFNQGDTVFDVLQAACKAMGVQLEYSFVPAYNSYYIQGIANLYEFDCGSTSGWTFKVNGWFPNYGCSEYEVKNGDTIVWCYSCEGSGTDVS